MCKLNFQNQSNQFFENSDKNRTNIIKIEIFGSVRLLIELTEIKNKSKAHVKVWKRNIEFLFYLCKKKWIFSFSTKIQLIFLKIKSNLKIMQRCKPSKHVCTWVTCHIYTWKHNVWYILQHHTNHMIVKKYWKNL